MKARPSPHVVAQDAHGESVLLDTSSHRFFELNQAATLIWRTLSAGKSIDEAAGEIAAHFDTDIQRARADVANLVEELRGLGLLVPESA